jgi:hypothetical protein
MMLVRETCTHLPMSHTCKDPGLPCKASAPRLSNFIAQRGFVWLLVRLDPVESQSSDRLGPPGGDVTGACHASQRLT